MRCATEEFNTRRAGLDVDDLSADPVVQWQRWHDEALEAGVAEPNAMTLSTIGLDDAPDARIVSGSRPRRTWPRVLHQLRQCQEPAAQSSAGRRGDLQLARPPSTGPEPVAPSTKCHPTRAMPTSRPGRAPRSSAPGHRRRVQRFPTAGRSTPESWQPRPASPASTRCPGRTTGAAGDCSPTEWEFWQGRPSRLHDRLRYTTDRPRSHRRRRRRSVDDRPPRPLMTTSQTRNRTSARLKLTTATSGGCAHDRKQSPGG